MFMAVGLLLSFSGLFVLVKVCNVYFKFGLIWSQLVQEVKFVLGFFFWSFYGLLGVWDKDSGEIYFVEIDLKLVMIMLVLEDKKKLIFSCDGMKFCVEILMIFDDWVCQFEKDYQDMLFYFKENDFVKVGELMEKNVLVMYVMIKIVLLVFFYLIDVSYEVMDFVCQFCE